MSDSWFDQELCPPDHVPGSIVNAWDDAALEVAIVTMRAHMRALIRARLTNPDLLQAISGTLALMIRLQRMRASGDYR